MEVGKRPSRVPFIIGFMALAVLLLIAIALPDVWAYRETRELQPGSRPAARAVLKAYQWSKLTGSYWENEIVEQARSIATKPLEERLEFYRAIVLHCDLQTSKALTFVEVVGEDAAPLRDNLRELKASSQFARLSHDAQQSVEDWITEMEIISQQKREEQEQKEQNEVR